MFERLFNRKPQSPQLVKPDFDQFWREFTRAINVNNYDSVQQARDFRNLFLKTTRGRRVLFSLLTWCHEYAITDGNDRVPPLDPNELQRWAALRELAALIKTAVYADLPAELPDIPEDED